MRNVIFSLGVICMLSSCQENKKPTSHTYPDPFRENFIGEPETIERWNFVIDSSGKLIPDSVDYETGEYVDNR